MEAKDDLKSVFAERMFKDLSFPKEEKAFDPLSRYIEEKADAEMPSVIFDELYHLYEEAIYSILIALLASSLHNGLVECMIKKENLKARVLSMSIHINAKKGDIADTILLPGDPLRAKYIAETFLEDVTQYNEVRNMFGYTGTYKGKRISVQGTGMGVPSISIYVTELMQEYDVQKLIRVGTCGAIQKDVQVRDVILAQSASTDSKMNEIIFNDINYAPTADFDLLIESVSMQDLKKDLI